MLVNPNEERGMLDKQLIRERSNFSNSSKNWRRIYILWFNWLDDVRRPIHYISAHNYLGGGTNKEASDQIFGTWKMCWAKERQGSIHFWVLWFVSAHFFSMMNHPLIIHGGNRLFSHWFSLHFQSYFRKTHTGFFFLICSLATFLDR